ncbi:F-box/FBD/LRR-repeat protein At4g00160-like [Vicia villosa]|uniref:F-box/FBD/LRR-repeat protein At4g00160-like n=1 Tax=Vicia villosa TaxID=3911 RepID=UPI00273ACC4D|nr:F-box/FBD/LRR-repeat protein At4g00160-like [Vicia villosa]
MEDTVVSTPSLEDRANKLLMSLGEERARKLSLISNKYKINKPSNEDRVNKLSMISISTKERARKRSLISTEQQDRLSDRKRSLISTEQPDRLSDLPDSILCHILSFLPTRLAAQTSILAKRWKPVWLSVTTLDFIMGITPNLIIYALMLSRDINLPILSFRVTCHFDYEPQVFDAVIMAAIQRRVETLELNMLNFPLEMKFVSNIFTSNTLTVLKLTNLYIVKDLPRINVSSIKTLHLYRVTFICHTYMINFFSAFPILEELHTYLVTTFDRAEEPGRMIKCLPNLVRANITDDPELFPLLSFSRAMVLKVNHTWKLYNFQVPLFNNLTQLELFPNFDQGMWILKLLQHTPKLQHLIIHHQEIEENDNNGIDDKNWKDLKMVPNCLSSQLKTCLFGYWRGKLCELQFAEYIMRNSKVLTTMTIHCSSSLDLNAKYQILQKLSMCPKGCKLIFD